VGVSELLSTLIMIAITLVAGAAATGFILGQAGTSSKAVGNAAATNVNFLSERYSIISAAMTSSTTATLWVYNNGNLNPETVASVLSYPTGTPAQGCTSSASTSTLSNNVVSKYNVVGVTLTLPSSHCTLTFSTGSSYTFVLTGTYGGTAQIIVEF